MEKKRMAFLSGTIFLLLIVPFVIYSQINAQNNEQLTQAEFVNVIIRVLGLENQLPVVASLSDKIRLLENLGYAPQGGWKLEETLTKGDTAVVLAQILGIDARPVGSTPQEYVQLLADRGIMTSGGAELPFSLPDLTTSVNTAAVMPGATINATPPPYLIPVSPFR